MQLESRRKCATTVDMPIHPCSISPHLWTRNRNRDQITLPVELRSRSFGPASRLWHLNLETRTHRLPQRPRSTRDTETNANHFFFSWTLSFPVDPREGKPPPTHPDTHFVPLAQNFNSVFKFLHVILARAESSLSCSNPDFLPKFFLTLHEILTEQKSSFDTFLSVT